MRIVISGTPGSGKSTTAKAVALKLNLKHYSMGDIQRQFAQQEGITIAELMKRAEKNPEIDKEIDASQTILGKNKDDFVIDGRLSAHFIPHADLKVFLDAKPEIRTERIWTAHRREEKAQSKRELLVDMEKRDAADDLRYQKLYGVSYRDAKLYDHTLDTTNLTPEEVVEQVVSWVRVSG